jgi:hypothetical protein
MKKKTKLKKKARLDASQNALRVVPVDSIADLTTQPYRRNLTA